MRRARDLRLPARPGRKLFNLPRDFAHAPANALIGPSGSPESPHLRGEKHKESDFRGVFEATAEPPSVPDPL
jgi:hypothetical protein